MSEYDLDALRVAVSKADDALSVNHAAALRVDAGVALFLAARSTLLTDAALGRALRAAAERDGVERETVAEAIVKGSPVATDDRNSWQFKNARKHAAAAAAALIAFVEAGNGH